MLKDTNTIIEDDEIYDRPRWFGGQQAKQTIPPNPAQKSGLRRYLFPRLASNSRLDPGQYLVVVPHVHQYLRVALDGIVQDAERAGLEVRGRRSRSRWCRFRHLAVDVWRVLAS